MGHEQVVEIWLTELAVGPRHRARREQARIQAQTATPKQERPAAQPEGPAEALRAA
jgi:hypothetical protein